MAIVGIDFGGSRLRIAVDGTDPPSLVNHPYAARRLPFVSRPASEGKTDQERWQIDSLKRLLDFDTIMPLPCGGQNSIACLAHLLAEACSALRPDGPPGERRVVVAVSPIFSQRRRSAIFNAANQAGLTRLRLVDDTLAAILASLQAVKGCRRLLVFSWGASLCSAALYHQRGEGFQILTQDGNRNFGGDDVDAVLAGMIWEALQKSGNKAHPIPMDTDAISREAERAKRRLARGESVSLAVDDLLGANTLTIPGSVSLSREDWEGVIAGMIDLAMTYVDSALNAANCSRPDGVLLTGGMARVPAVRQALAERLKAPLYEAADEAVAVGGVLFGRSLAEDAWGESEQRTKGPAPSSQVPEERANRWADLFIPYLNSAQQHEQQGQVEEGVATFEHLFAELSKFSSTLYRQLGAKLGRAGRLEEAFHLLRRHHQRDRGNSLVAADLAEICLQQGVRAYQNQQFPIAIEKAGLAVATMRPLSNLQGQLRFLAEAQRVKALALYAQGQLLEAEKAMVESIHFDPSQEQCQRDLEKIRAELKKKCAVPGPVVKTQRPGRNDPCPCGSGSKYKKCCGRH